MEINIRKAAKIIRIMPTRALKKPRKKPFLFLRLGNNVKIMPVPIHSPIMIIVIIMINEMEGI